MSSTIRNKVKYGLCNVYYAKLINDNTYDTPVSVAGAVSISLKPAGSSNTVYADNVAYFDMETNNGYTGNIEFALIPDDFRTDIIGEEIDANGVQSENADNHGSYFALCFQFEGDVYEKRHVLYRCKATRPNIESESTKDKTENKNETLDLTCYPSMGSGYLRHRVKASIDNTTEHQVIYDSWFDKVYDGATSALSTLTVTSAAGSTTGKTALTVTPTLTSGNSYMYKTAATVTLPAYNDVCNTTASYTAWDGTSDITATTGNEIAVVEVDSSFKAIKAGKATVTSK